MKVNLWTPDNGESALECQRIGVVKWAFKQKRMYLCILKSWRVKKRQNITHDFPILKLEI